MRKYSIIAFVILIFFFITNSTTYAIEDCIDTDGGINYFVKGNITQPSTGITAQDHCTSETTMAENYCGEPYNITRLHVDYHTCPNGCKDGACIEEETEISECYNEDTGYFSPSCLEKIRCKKLEETEVNKTALREDKNIFPDLELPEICNYETVYDLLIEEDIDSRLELVESKTLSPIRDDTVVYFYWIRPRDECSETKKFNYYLLCEKNEAFDHYPTCRGIYDLEDLKVSCNLWYKMMDSEDNEKIDIIVFLPKNSITPEEAKKDLENKGMSIVRVSELSSPPTYMFVGTSTKSEIYELSEIEWIKSEGIWYNGEVITSSMQSVPEVKYQVFSPGFVKSEVVDYVYIFKDDTLPKTVNFEDNLITIQKIEIKNHHPMVITRDVIETGGFSAYLYNEKQEKIGFGHSSYTGNPYFKENGCLDESGSSECAGILGIKIKYWYEEPNEIEKLSGITSIYYLKNVLLQEIDYDYNSEEWNYVKLALLLYREEQFPPTIGPTPLKNVNNYHIFLIIIVCIVIIGLVYYKIRK